MIKYLHAADGYPTEDTCTKVIKAGNRTTWPALAVTNIHKHFPESNETQKGNMKCQHQRVHSTKILETITEEDDEPVLDLSNHMGNLPTMTKQVGIPSTLKPKKEEIYM